MPIPRENAIEVHNYERELESETIAGMEFAVFRTRDGEKRYHPVQGEDGEVNRQPFTHAYVADGYTVGILESSEREVMIDEDGIHYDWG